MPKFISFLAMIFLMLHSTRSEGALASVILTENNQDINYYQNITAHLSVAESSAGLNIEPQDLNDADILNFKPIAKNQVSFPYSPKTRWIRFEIQNQSPQIIEKYFIFDTPISGTMFVVNDQGKTITTIGSSVPGANFTSHLSIPHLKLRLLPNEKQIYFFALRSRHNVNGEFALVNDPYFITRNEDMITWFYTGGILSLFFFNLLTYIFTREIFYKSYLLYAGTFLLFVLNIKGKLDQWFFNPHFTFSHYLICFSTTLAISTLFFTHNFLKIKIKSRAHNYFFWSMISLFVLLFILGLTPLYEWFSPLPGYTVDIGIMVACIYMISMGIISLKENKIFSIIFLLSWSFVFLGVFSWFGMKWEILPGNLITENILLIASLLEMATLSLGISIRQLEWQKEKSLISQKASEKEKFERLLRVLTHDLANPLTLILANSKRLLVRDELTFQNSAIEKVYLAAENMKKVITKVREEELLNIAATDGLRSNVVEAVNYSLIFFEEQLQKKHLSVELNLNKEIYLEIDRTVLINNIFNNVISNAIKFSHVGGKIKINTLTTNRDIIIEFRDYGVGIKSETLTSLEKFEDIHSTKGTFNESGSGFGLRLIRDYMNKFGGAVEIISHGNNQDKNDQGTTIRLIFPKVSK